MAQPTSRWRGVKAGADPLEQYVADRIRAERRRGDRTPLWPGIVVALAAAVSAIVMLTSVLHQLAP